MLADFLEALRHREFATRFDRRGGAGFDRLGTALGRAMEDLQRERLAAERELRFLEALVDDAPVALLRTDPERGVLPANKAARRMFDRHAGTRPADFAVYGATFAERLEQPAAGGRELLLLRLTGGLQRALVRSARLERLGAPAHIISVEPVQGTLDAVEIAAQTDLVRVLTHEILNSLTPVMSLSRTVEGLLAADPLDLPTARQAAETLARRTASLRTFIDSYQAVARPPQPRPIRFAAAAVARELERLFRAEWPNCALEVDVGETLELEADPDLLGQVLINLLRNAAQASSHLPAPQVRLAMRAERGLMRIEVEDNGPGIPPARRSEVFLPFYTTRPGGTGVGLNLVRQIAVASGWSVEVDTGSLGGALLRLLLPR
jgi:nitrogen fixation/metabolism regulation signal transduction histidine kinase